MNKEMIICSNDHETRVAILEDDLVSEIFVERERQRGVVGNIYKGRVSKVLPGMQSAFVDIGLERDGFLYVSDVVNEEFEKLDPDEEGEEKRDDGARGPREEPKIEDLLREGQEVLVQVAKEPLGTKGARLTSHASLAGRFLVFMPTVDHIGVSRKIDSRDERARLRGIVREYREQQGFTGGIIIRTAASGRSKDDILIDLDYFNRIWTEVRKKTEALRAPTVVYREDSLVAKLLRDLLTDEFSAVRIDHPQEHQRVLQLVERMLPALAAAGEAVREAVSDLRGIRRPGRARQGAPQQGVAEVGRVDRDQPDRSARRHRRQHRALRRQAHRRPAGGHDRQDESRGGQGDRAADPAPRSRRDHRARLHRHGGPEEPPEGASRRSSRSSSTIASPSKALQVSDFGLIVITRKRVKQSLERVLTEPCPYCSGSGVIKSSSTICYEILAEVKKLGADLNGHAVVLRVNPDIARALKEEESAVLKDLRAVARQGRHHPARHAPAPRAVRRDGGGVITKWKMKNEKWKMHDEDATVKNASNEGTCRVLPPLGILHCFIFHFPFFISIRSRPPASRRRQMNQVVVAAPIDPHAHIVVSLQHFHACGAGERRACRRRPARCRFRGRW